MRPFLHIRSVARFALLLVAAPLVASHAQPGFPPNDPDSWVVAGTAKILCSSLFVSGREDAEARAHMTTYFIGAKLDSITKVDIDRQRKLVRVTLANRITREAKLYADQGCVIHQPGRDSVFFKPVRVTTTLPAASTLAWPMGDVLQNAPLPPNRCPECRKNERHADQDDPAQITQRVFIQSEGERFGNFRCDPD